MLFRPKTPTETIEHAVSQFQTMRDQLTDARQALLDEAAELHRRLGTIEATAMQGESLVRGLDKLLSGE